MLKALAPESKTMISNRSESFQLLVEWPENFLHVVSGDAVSRILHMEERLPVRDMDLQAFGSGVQRFSRVP